MRGDALFGNLCNIFGQISRAIFQDSGGSGPPYSPLDMLLIPFYVLMWVVCRSVFFRTDKSQRYFEKKIHALWMFELNVACIFGNLFTKIDELFKIVCNKCSMKCLMVLIMAKFIIITISNHRFIKCMNGGFYTMMAYSNLVLVCQLVTAGRSWFSSIIELR